MFELGDEGIGRVGGAAAAAIKSQRIADHELGDATTSDLLADVGEACLGVGLGRRLQREGESQLVAVAQADALLAVVDAKEGGHVRASRVKGRRGRGEDRSVVSGAFAFPPSSDPLNPMSMSPSLQDLYGRQMRLPGHGESGQLRLREAKVLLIGAGGLGSPTALYLAAAGVGTLGIADPDKVELSNLHRQILHAAESIGLPKTVSAAETLTAINPSIRLVLHPEGLQADNALDLVRRYDVVVDGADNFGTRFLVSDACVLARKPLIHGSVLRGAGQVGAFLPATGCYRCLYPVMPDPASVPTCGEVGVLGATCGVIGSWMASETMAVLLGRRQHSRLLLVDVDGGTARAVAVTRDGDCPSCGNQPSFLAIDPARYAVACNPQTVMSNHPLEVTVTEAKQLLDQPSPPVLVDVREADELAICRIHGAVHIPLGELPARLGEIPSDRPVLIHCHHGGRSLRATQFLRAQGRPAVSNVKGGIDAWSRLIDPSVPRY